MEATARPTDRRSTVRAKCSNTVSKGSPVIIISRARFLERISMLALPRERKSGQALWHSLERWQRVA
jgi:hypothetical protein